MAIEHTRLRAMHVISIDEKKKYEEKYIALPFDLESKVERTEDQKRKDNLLAYIRLRERQEKEKWDRQAKLFIRKQNEIDDL